MDTTRHILIAYTKVPGIIQHGNPRAGRMKFLNSINNERNKVLKMVLQDAITVITRGKGNEGRILIGPKSFDSYLDWRFPLETCSTEELIDEFNRTYPMDQLIDVDKAMSEDTNRLMLNVDTKKKLQTPFLEGLEALKAKHKETPTIDVDPYAVDPSSDENPFLSKK